MRSVRLTLIIVLVATWLLSSCSSSRYVPEGSYLLDRVRIYVPDSVNALKESDLTPYLRQQANHRMLWSMRFRLGLYNMAGSDTTKWWNRWWRKLGEPPVIYDSALTEQSADQLRKVMINKGYLHADVVTDTLINPKKRKATVEYHLLSGARHVVSSVDYSFPDDSLRNMIMRLQQRFPVREGDPFDRSLLDSQRELVTSYMRARGYYAFSRDYITFNADTTEGSLDVDLTMTVSPDKALKGTVVSHKSFLVRRLICVADYNPSYGDDLTSISAADTVGYRDMTILYGEKHYLRSSVIYDNCFLRVGRPYSEPDVNRTYQALSRLTILKFINIRFVPAGGTDETGFVDAYILLTPGRSQSVALELEGTNSEGDLGVAVGATYTHRNVGRGSETLTAKLRGAYESITGKLDGLLHNRYMEYSVDLGVTFPKFKATFLSDNFKRRINASTEFNVSMNYQERPEYTRIISTAGWSYKWTERTTRNRHTFTPVDINYVYLPESTYNFLDEIAPDNPLLRYSYEDHFIMRLGYGFYHTNKRPDTPGRSRRQRNVYTIRLNSEIAGNFLFLLNSIINPRPDFHIHPYKIFGIHYSQYVKADADYSLTHIFDYRNSLAFHAGFGIGIPYGNSTILPFEKRFYGGGANGVRGWDVRTLGPGSYPGTNSVSDFINQCGDIRLDLSVEYRLKLFWLLEMGAFIDMGNIWTIRDYSNQPGGMFRFNSFYKEIAAAYGVGLRLDFNYFLLRFDLGMKAHNPAKGEYPWPLIRPRWHRDSSFHFSIGYPF